VLDREGRALLAPPPSGPRAGRGRALIERSGRVGALGWQVIAAQPEDEVTEPIRALERGILQNTQTTLRAMRSDIGRVARGTSARLQKDALAVREQTAARVRNSSEQVFEALKQTTERQTKRTLVEMQHAIATRSRQTDEDSSRRMVGASAAASERLAERVTPLTAAALARANRRLALGALVILGVSCAAGCLVALLIAGRIVRPVIRLSQSARSIAEGDLDGRVDERAPDEIGDLAAAFNSMAASLQKSRAELQGAEAQLVQSAKLASLGTLAAGVAHELNQPVAIVRGISQQLRGEPGLSPDVRADLELIEGQTSRMMKIIKHLRTFSRVGGPELADVAVNAVVRDCFVLVGAQLKAHDIDVEWDLCEDEPGRGGGALVRGDANELEQVFLNLITNARDAVENRKGGRLAISSRLEGDRFVLVFRDNGTGIPEAVLPHIFDPFFTTKDPGKGTGLGLSISHGIIAKHGGTITARNDNGAVFTISLPVAPAAAGNETPAGPIPLAKAA
jgi:C4-dicarboxylate-specific signal transduction histidine kinase